MATAIDLEETLDEERRATKHPHMEPEKLINLTSAALMRRNR